MVYHSAFNVDEPGMRQACGCALLPFHTASRDAAATAEASSTDIVEEAISLFRPNVFFQNFDVRGSGDKLLIYLSLFIACCLNRLAETKAKRLEAEKVLYSLAHEAFKGPGEAGFALEGVMAAPADAQEEERIQLYLRQARQELARRLVPLVYEDDGSLSKWWLAFANRRFLGKRLS